MSELELELEARGWLEMVNVWVPIEIQRHGPWEDSMCGAVGRLSEGSEQVKGRVTR